MGGGEPRGMALETAARADYGELVLDFLAYLEFERGLSRNTLEAYRTDLLQLGQFLERSGLDALRTIVARGAGSIVVRPDVQARYNAAIQKRLRNTVWNAGGCASWYLDHTGRNTTLWPGFTWPFRRLLRRFDADHYELRPAAPAPEPVAA